MFGMGFFELLIIAVVALVFVGPKKLPEVMRQAGKFFVQMRRTANDVRSTFDQVVKDAEDEIRREEAETLKGLLTSTTEPKAPPAVIADPTHNPDGTLKSAQVAPHGGYVPGELQQHAPEGSKTYGQGGTPTGITQDAHWHPVTSSTTSPLPSPTPPTVTEAKPSSDSKPENS